MINDLNFVTPESEGITSESILEFIDFFEEQKINIHSFLISRHGNIVAEGYFKPFDKDTKKRLYSCSKSITSLAVGKLFGEGLVDLQAPIASYFPDITPTDIMKEVTVEDALTMRVPMSGKSYCKFPGSNDPDTVEFQSFTNSFFSDYDTSDKPRGTLFRYNSLASSMLAELVLRVSGKNFLDYLRPELDKIGVARDIECIKTPNGVDWGASGVLATTRDFAKIGELVLNKGLYKGEELIPRAYMEKATSRLTDTVFAEGISSGSYGYGYQIWCEPYGYGLHGMRGQVVHCFPEKDFMVVINSNEPDFYKTHYYAASRIYKSISDKPLAENPTVYGELTEKIGNLRVDRSFGEAHSPAEKNVGGKKYTLKKNAMGIECFTLDFEEKRGVFTFVMNGEEKRLPFGYAECEDTVFPDRGFYGKQMNVKSGREFRTLCTGSWTSENRLLIFADVSDDTPGSLGIVFEFNGDSVSFEMRGAGEGILRDYNGYCSGTSR